ncbi:MAG TPA: hypothetical protein VLG47_05815 [Candidatus Saccharimonadales bacterium]|nr:hypothetical protein [Candidatus Saccharimonadales bacterium]
MVSKNKKYQNKQANQDKLKNNLTIAGAWIVALVTLAAAADMSRTAREPRAVSSVHPVYAFADNGVNQWNRNDNENETVHLPTKFDIGVRINAVSGRK